MTQLIEEAYDIYRRITCRYEDRERNFEIFTDDFGGGNASYGRICGIEAQIIF